MNMVNRQELKPSFLEASELEATDCSHVQLLNNLKDSLESTFNEEFGDDAFLMYYLGKRKHHIYNEDDQLVRKEDGNPKTITKDFMSHFAHEKFADEFGINFVSLHMTVFKPYFMALAMHEYTKNLAYDELASDFFEDIVEAVNNNLKEGFGKLNENGKSRIADSMGYAVSTMREHKMPRSLRMANLIDPMSKEENPGPKLDPSV